MPVSAATSDRHRFTKSSEIVLRHVSDGNRAVEDINRMHRRLIAAGMQAG